MDDFKGDILKMPLGTKRAKPVDFEQDLIPTGGIIGGIHHGISIGGMHVGIGHPVFEKKEITTNSGKIRVDKIGVVEKEDIDISGKIKPAVKIDNSKDTITKFGDALPPPDFTDELQVKKL